MLPLRWFLITPCSLCGQELDGPRSGPGQACRRCCEQLELPTMGLMGTDPLCWWAAGHYAGGLRQLLLDLRRRPRLEAVATLAGQAHGALLAAGGGPGKAHGQRHLLVPIPSWKRRANPLPPLVCRALERQGPHRRVDLLERSRPVLGQHHLGRRLRFANQDGAFRCQRPPGPGEARRRSVLIVDDILTTGATATSAAQCLRAAGWRVEGLLCLARTGTRRGDQAVP